MSVKLEVGKTYLNCRGQPVKIIAYNERICVYKYLGHNGNIYDYAGNSVVPSANIITEHNPEDL